MAMEDFINAEEDLRSGMSPDQIMRSDKILTRVYGGYFTEAGIWEHYKLKSGEELVLKPDTANVVDCFAINVFSKRGVKLGFIKKELAAAIISIHDFSCKVANTMDVDESIGRTRNSFGVWIFLIRKKK